MRPQIDITKFAWSDRNLPPGASDWTAEIEYAWEIGFDVIPATELLEVDYAGTAAPIYVPHGPSMRIWTGPRGRRASEYFYPLYRRRVSISLPELSNLQAEWSDATFGIRADPLPTLKHLRKEVDEVIANPDDQVEYADVLLLLLDAWRRRGGTVAELLEVAHQKHLVCRSRKWGAPDENGVCEHIREAGE